MTRPKKHIHIPARIEEPVEAYRPDSFAMACVGGIALVVLIYAIAFGLPL